MSTNTDTKLDPKEETIASTEPRLAQQETQMATHPKGDPESEAPTAHSAAEPAAEEPAVASTSAEAATGAAPTYTEAATGAASTAAAAVTATAANMKDSVFGMFGGGAKKEKKVEDEGADEPSGSSKKKGEEVDDDETPESPEVHFTPVVHLTQKVEVKSDEDHEEQTFKMRAKLFKFDRDTREWKERGTGDVRLFKHRDNGKTRLVMRRDKTLKVCANHSVVPDMKLSPNVGSDRSWVWNAAADVSEGEPEACTLAIRFANSENANLFKEAFIKAQQDNEALFKADNVEPTEAKPVAEEAAKET